MEMGVEVDPRAEKAVQHGCFAYSAFDSSWRSNNSRIRALDRLFFYRYRHTSVKKRKEKYICKSHSFSLAKYNKKKRLG